MNGPRFTDGRVPDAGIRRLFTLEHPWQRWLDVEGALAAAQADVGMVPHAAAAAIGAAAHLERLDVDCIHGEIAETSHPLMALIAKLALAPRDPPPSGRGPRVPGDDRWGGRNLRRTRVGRARGAGGRGAPPRPHAHDRARPQHRRPVRRARLRARDARLDQRPERARRRPVDDDGGRRGPGAATTCDRRQLDDATQTQPTAVPGRDRDRRADPCARAARTRGDAAEPRGRGRGHRDHGRRACERVHPQRRHADPARRHPRRIEAGHGPDASQPREHRRPRQLGGGDAGVGQVDRTAARPRRRVRGRHRGQARRTPFRRCTGRRPQIRPPPGRHGHRRAPDPLHHTGRSSEIARNGAALARTLAARLRR